MDLPPPRNLSFGQLHTALSPTFLGLVAVTDPALLLTHQPPPLDQTLRCNTCKQAQPLVAYKSRSVPRVITKNCLRCRNNWQGSTRRAARSVSVTSAVTSDSNATRLSDIDSTYPQPPQPTLPVQPFPPCPFPAPPATQTLAREQEQNPSVMGLNVQEAGRPVDSYEGSTGVRELGRLWDLQWSSLRFVVEAALWQIPPRSAQVKVVSQIPPGSAVNMIVWQIPQRSEARMIVR